MRRYKSMGKFLAGRTVRGKPICAPVCVCVCVCVCVYVCVCMCVHMHACLQVLLIDQLNSYDSRVIEFLHMCVCVRKCVHAVHTCMWV